jgi:hypothetical protein
MLLVKAVLAILAALLFVYYKLNWERAKRHLPVHFFYAKWRAVRHAVALGAAAVGFAIGFSIELFGEQLGFSAGKARFFSSLFEIGSLFAMLFVFFELCMEDVPHFQRLSQAARHHAHAHQEEAPKAAVKRAKGKKRRR